MQVARSAFTLVGPLVVVVVWTAFAAGCAAADQPIPIDRPLYPTGLALIPGADAGDPAQHLLVVSSDFDKAFTDPSDDSGLGALLSADLDAVRTSNRGTVTDAYASGVVIPAFGDDPVLSPRGDRVYVPTKGGNTVASIDINPDGSLTCQSSQTPQRCGVSPGVLQLSRSDPAVVLPLSQSGDGQRVTGLVALLSSSELSLFVDDKARSGAQRMQVTGTIDLGGNFQGVRAAALRPQVAGTDPVVIAAADLNNDAGLIGGQVLVFNPTPDTNIVNFDMSAATGSLSLRDLILVPGDDGEDDAVIVVLRSPDALARLEIDDAGSLPTLRLSKLAPACHEPTNLALWHDPAGSHPDRVLLTCRTGQTVAMLDPRTLEATDAMRFAGRDPFDVVVDQVAGEAFVSFFEDDSVGMLSLADADGTPQLTFAKRIGKQAAAPEDGRE